MAMKKERNRKVTRKRNISRTIRRYLLMLEMTSNPHEINLDSIANEKSKPEKVLYDTFRPCAETIKIGLQMFIGVLLVFFLGTKFIFHFFNIGYDWSKWLGYLEYIHSLKTLIIVSSALAYSAGIELAYMLFTPGPDEAIAPLVTSAAAGLMHAIANVGKLDIQVVFSMLLYVIVIASLFMVKEIFTKDDEDKARKPLIDYLRK